MVTKTIKDILLEAMVGSFLRRLAPQEIFLKKLLISSFWTHQRKHSLTDQIFLFNQKERLGYLF